MSTTQTRSDGQPDGPFHGIKVLELGQYVSVPYCAELLAHGGADVIKVEPIAGDETRKNSEIVPGEGRQYIIKARGKRGIPVDLASDEGRDLVRLLAAKCDVVLSNMRPGVVERLGLDYASLAKVNPSVIFGEIVAFGRQGPDGHKAGIDVVAQAYSGLMISGKGTDDGLPAQSEAFLADYMSGTLLAFGIASALRVRDQTGKGQAVSTSLLQAALALQHASANVFEAVDSWKRELVTAKREGQEDLDSLIQRRRSLRAANIWWSTTYRTLDGYVVVGAAGQLRRKLAEVLGLHDPSFDPGWTPPDDPRAHMAALTARARDLASRWRTDDLIAELEARGVPCSPVQFVEEVMLGEQARANGFVYSLDHPRVGPAILPEAPVSFSWSSYKAASSSPAYGEHTQEILEEIGLASDQITGLVDRKIVGRAAD